MDRQDLEKRHSRRSLPMRWGRISARPQHQPLSDRAILPPSSPIYRSMMSFLLTRFIAFRIMSKRFSIPRWRIMRLTSSSERGPVHALCVWILRRLLSWVRRQRRGLSRLHCVIVSVFSPDWNTIRPKPFCSSLNARLIFSLCRSNVRELLRLHAVRGERRVLQTAS